MLKRVQNYNVPDFGQPLVFISSYHGLAKYGKVVAKSLSFLSTWSEVTAAFAVPIGPPKISNNSTSITSSDKVLPVNTFVQSKKVVFAVLETFKTSVAKSPVKSAAVCPKAFVV